MKSLYFPPILLIVLGTGAAAQKQVQERLPYAAVHDPRFIPASSATNEIAVEFLRGLHFWRIQGVATHITDTGAGVLVRLVGIPSRHEDLRCHTAKALCRPRHGQGNAFFSEYHGQKLCALTLTGVT